MILVSFQRKGSVTSTEIWLSSLHFPLLRKQEGSEVL